MSPWVMPEPEHVCKFPWAEISKHKMGDVWECDVCENVYRLGTAGAGTPYFQKVTWE